MLWSFDYSMLTEEVHADSIPVHCVCFKKMVNCLSLVFNHCVCLYSGCGSGQKKSQRNVSFCPEFHHFLICFFSLLVFDSLVFASFVCFTPWLHLSKVRPRLSPLLWGLFPSLSQVGVFWHTALLKPGSQFSSKETRKGDRARRQGGKGRWNTEHHLKQGCSFLPGQL